MSEREELFESLLERLKEARTELEETLSSRFGRPENFKRRTVIDRITREIEKGEAAQLKFLRSKT